MNEQEGWCGEQIQNLLASDTIFMIVDQLESYTIRGGFDSKTLIVKHLNKEKKRTEIVFS